MAPGPTQPSLSVASAAGSGAKDDVPPPISPVTRQGSFPHKTVSAAATQPFINTATPAINTVPVELDGTPTSPATIRVRKASLSQASGEGANPEARAAQHASRAADPAVLVDIPGTPAATELEVASQTVGENVAEKIAS